MQTYRSIVEPEIMRRIGDVKIERVGRLLVDQWMAEMKRSGVSADRRGRALMYLRSILDYGVVTERIGTNPAAAVKRPKVPAKTPKTALAPAQIEEIASHMARPEDVMYLRLMAYAGLRPGEIRGLEWSSLQSKTLIVAAPKTNRVDTIDLLEPLAKNLKEFKLASPDTSGQIIPGNWTKTNLDNWRKRIFNPAAAAAGWGSSKERTRSDGRVVTDYSAEITPYNLRHSYASLLIHAGRPLTYVAAQMRHSLEMTMRTYAHVIADLDHSELVDPARLILQSQGEHRGHLANR